MDLLRRKLNVSYPVLSRKRLLTSPEQLRGPHVLEAVRYVQLVLMLLTYGVAKLKITCAEPVKLSVRH